MLRFKKMMMVVICLFILVPILSANAEEEIDDLIDIFEANGKGIAVIKGERTVSIDLRTRETTRWKNAAGHMAALLTNERFLVISTSSGAWRALPLRLEESRTGTVYLSPFIALLVTKNRAVVFHARSNKFIETQFPIYDELISAKAEKYVAVVIISSRALGLSAKSTVFSEILFRDRETIEEISITSRKATIRTSDRLLNFGAKSSGWSEHRF